MLEPPLKSIREAKVCTASQERNASVTLASQVQNLFLSNRAIILQPLGLIWGFFYPKKFFTLWGCRIV